MLVESLGWLRFTYVSDIELPFLCHGAGTPVRVCGACCMTASSLMIATHDRSPVGSLVAGVEEEGVSGGGQQQQQQPGEAALLPFPGPGPNKLARTPP
jgi:hypothetical protein